jgi:integrase
LIERWPRRLIADVNRGDVVDMIREISNSGRPYAAAKTFAYASKLFNWAAARGTIERSPCSGIRATEINGRSTPRHRVLSDSEMAALWRATDGLGYPSAPFVRFLLLSGQRLREVAEMRWPEIDLDKALWTIPAERMKAEAAHEIPLPPAAIDILKGLPPHRPGRNPRI